MDSSRTRSKRPNRSAKARRDQYLRADSRMLARLLSMERALSHRGSQPSKAFATTLEHFRDLSSSAAAPSASTMAQASQFSAGVADLDVLSASVGDLHNKIEQSMDLVHQQLDILGSQMAHIDGMLGALCAPSAATLSAQTEKHELEELLDPVTLAKIRQLQSTNVAVQMAPPVDTSAIAPDDVMDGVDAPIPSIASDGSADGQNVVAFVSASPAASEVATLRAQLPGRFRVRGKQQMRTDSSATEIGEMPMTQVTSSGAGSCSSVWWQCPECAYNITYESVYKSQMKSQHKRSHMQHILNWKL